MWSAASLFDSLESTFVTVFIPFIGPLARADANSRLPEVGALVFITGLLQAKEPFVVTIPAVQSLVLGGEALITRGGTNILDLVQEIFFLLRKLGNLVAENL